MISVIIPLYNAESYIIKAIESVISQEEVTEVVIIDDGSTDDGFYVVSKFIEPYPFIKLYQHEGAVNKGRSRSRNLGIRKASNEYVAFLDSDDFYLLNRFKNDILVLKDNDIDGVYNAIGVHFYREASDFEREALKLTSVSEPIEPQFLFEELLYFRKGHFSLDGLTLKKKALEDVGCFDEQLEVGEDIQLILKLSLIHTLKPGIIDKPVCLRGVHETNIFNRADVYKNYRIKSYERLLTWALNRQVPKTRIDHILNYLWRLKYIEENNLFKLIHFWFKIISKNSSLLFSKLSVKYFPLIRLRKKLFKLH